MPEKPARSFWDRWNWTPVVPLLVLGWWIFQFYRAGWQWGWFRIAGTTVTSVWLLLAISDKLTGGKAVDWMNSSDDENEG